MAINQITYSNKSYINQNPSIAETNKVTDTDMNEIKSVVNANANIVGDSSDLNEADVITAINNIKGQILWTNPHPTSNFAAQSITLSSSNYDIYEVIYSSEASGSLSGVLNTSRSIKGYGTVLETINPAGSLTPIRVRNVNYVSDTSLSFSTGYSSNAYPLPSDNSKCIPLYVIGYKTGLF